MIIFRSIYGLPWIIIFVMSQAIPQWFSWVSKSRVKVVAEKLHDWQKIPVQSNPLYVLFLTRYTMQWTYIISTKTISSRSSHHFHQGLSFLIDHCDVTTVDLWRHVKARFWYCDVLFVDCSCSTYLMQSWSSPVNNKREYRSFATRYSWLSL